MDLISVLSSFESITNDSYLSSTYSALVFCLTSVHACSLFDFSFNQEYKKRLAILKKIRSDIQKNYIDYHEEFINKLMNIMADLPYNKRVSCGFALNYLIEYVPKEKQQEIILFFLTSKWKPIRKRGYKYLLNNWDKSWIDKIELNWNQWSDFGAARLIIEYFPIQFLNNQFENLISVVEKNYLKNKLYLKVVPSDLSKLKELRKRDSITYAYILVNLNMKIDYDEALRIFNENKADDRMGLLIWCYGQMGLWSVIHIIYQQLDEVRQARFEVFSERE